VYTKAILMIIGSATVGAVVSAWVLDAKNQAIIEQSVNLPVATQSESESYPDSETSQLADGQSLAVLRRELSLLAQQVASLEKRLDKRNNDNHNKGSAPVVSVQDQSEAENLRPDEVLAVAEEEAVIAERLEYFDSYINSESQDISWAAEAEQTIYNAFNSQELLGSQIATVDCRSTLCRAEIDHNSMSDLMNFKLEFASKVSSMLPKGSMQHIESSSGRQKTIVFMARKGHSFPETRE